MQAMTKDERQLNSSPSHPPIEKVAGSLVCLTIFAHTHNHPKICYPATPTVETQIPFKSQLHIHHSLFSKHVRQHLPRHI